VQNALQVFQQILARQEGSYVAGGIYTEKPEGNVLKIKIFLIEEITIADLPLVMGTVLLEVIEFDLSPYPKVKSWYEGFKLNQKELWTLAEQGLKELQEFEKNPPDFSQIRHPLHPTDRSAMQITSINAVAPAEEPVVVSSSPAPPQEI
jgi:glutathione S-transferase